jgi:hypothetical protein
MSKLTYVLQKELGGCMKYTAILASLAFLTFSCSFAYVSLPDFWIFDDPMVNSPCRNYNDIYWFVAHNYKYREDYKDNWQSPSETAYYKEGDCEDLCIMVIGLLAKKFNQTDTYLIAVDADRDGKIDHAEILFNGKQINSLGMPVNDPIFWKISYQELPFCVKKTLF